MVETEQSNGNMQILPPSNVQNKQLWIMEQVTILAEAFGEVVTPERLRIYAQDLSDLEHDQLTRAFSRARRELKFFPKIAELRTLAGASAEELVNVEAEEAWAFVCKYLEEYGVDRLPSYHAGKLIHPPPLPGRIDYALRRIGGLRGLNQITAQSHPFMRRDFIAAYNQFSLSEQFASPLRKLLSGISVRRHLQTGPDAVSPRHAESRATTPVPTAKLMPTPLNAVQRRERLEMLQQQLALLRLRKTTETDADKSVKTEVIAKQ